MKSVCLELDDAIHLEHELFRSCMQSAVALENDGFSRKAQKEQAVRLREIANKYISTDKFYEISVLGNKCVKAQFVWLDGDEPFIPNQTFSLDR